VLVDRVLASSAMFGADQRTGTVPDDAEEEVRCLFENISTVLELAGGSSADVVRMGVLVRDSADRALVNEEWLAMFPDENDRPARHITVVPNLPVRVQIEFLALLSDEEK
jgi:2-iminobutanoate/2-iminopropanoate deaminase